MVKAHLSLSGWNGHLIAELESGIQLVATTSEQMAKQLTLAGVTVEELTVTNWKEDMDHAPSSGAIVAIKSALRSNA
jgi:hypothetical protein